MLNACVTCAAPCPPGRSRCDRHALALSASGSTRRWRRIRARILQRDPICTLRLVCAGAPSTQVDHRVPRWAGGSDDDSNLRGSCGPCNLARGAGEGGRFITGPAAGGGQAHLAARKNRGDGNAGR
jgi:5-methylcytosine-specific restriction endonuclease McrA